MSKPSSTNTLRLLNTYNLAIGSAQQISEIFTQDTCCDIRCKHHHTNNEIFLSSFFFSFFSLDWGNTSRSSSRHFGDQMEKLTYYSCVNTHETDMHSCHVKQKLGTTCRQPSRTYDSRTTTQHHV